MGDRRKAKRARLQAALASTYAAFPGVYASYFGPETRPTAKIAALLSEQINTSFRLAGIPPAPELPTRAGTFGIIRVKPACTHSTMTTNQGLNVCPSCGVRVWVGLDMARKVPVVLNNTVYDGIVDHSAGLVSLRPMKGGGA